MKVYKTKKGQAVPNHRRRKGKKAENNIDLATQNQTLKQQIDIANSPVLTLRCT
jgi:hypothetical protein